MNNTEAQGWESEFREKFVLLDCRILSNTLYRKFKKGVNPKDIEYFIDSAIKEAYAKGAKDAVESAVTNLAIYLAGMDNWEVADVSSHEDYKKDALEIITNDKEEIK